MTSRDYDPEQEYPEQERADKALDILLDEVFVPHMGDEKFSTVIDLDGMTTLTLNADQMVALAKAVAK